jgi:hypothetical protein
MELKNTTADDVAGLIGFSATLKLLAWCADKNTPMMYVPEKIPENHPISVLIGRRNAERLSSEFGSMQVYLGTMQSFENNFRDGLICRMLRMELPLLVIATTFGITRRRAQQLQKEFVAKGLVKMPGKNAPENRGENAPENRGEIAPKNRGEIAPENRGENAPENEG